MTLPTLVEREKVKSVDAKLPQHTKDKENGIIDAFRQFRIIMTFISTFYLLEMY